MVKWSPTNPVHEKRRTRYRKRRRKTYLYPSRKELLVRSRLLKVSQNRATTERPSCCWFLSLSIICIYTGIYALFVTGMV